MSLPLSDVRVVDCGQFLAGPLVATFMADMGADAIKIEEPTGETYRTSRRELNGQGYNPAFELFNRNKRSLALDLKTDEGYEAITSLLEKSDIFVQNWPPGVAERLGLDYETVRDLNEDIVYVHVTGYGETGPMANAPGMDTIAQHVSGFSSMLGYDDDRPPIRSQSSLADFFAAYSATLSAMGALRQVDRGESGQKVDVSLLEALAHNMDGAFEFYNNLGEVPYRAGRSAFYNENLLYGAAEAADGWVCVALLLYSERVWNAFCDLLDRDDLREEYPTDADRLEDAGMLTDLFEDWLAEQPTEEAVEMLNEAGIPAAKHNTVAEAAELDHMAARDVFRTVEHPRFGEVTLTDSPLDLSETPIREPEHSPLLGEHSREVLAELGYSEAEIDALVEDAVVVEDAGYGE
ncbi:MAG: CaiB/BaiF CoA transferase family protein [Haloarculaceae archaeon]